MQAGLSMPKITLSQSQPKVPPSHSETLHSSTKHGYETGSDDDSTTEAENSESESEDKKIASSEAAKRLQEHLEQIKEAPTDQQKRRRSRRLLSKEDATTDPTLSSHPQKSLYKKGRSRRDRRGRRTEDQLLESQVTDSQLLQVTYDNPKDRKEKEKLLARIDR